MRDALPTQGPAFAAVVLDTARKVRERRADRLDISERRFTMLLSSRQSHSHSQATAACAPLTARHLMRVRGGFGLAEGFAMSKRRKSKSPPPSLFPECQQR